MQIRAKYMFCWRPEKLTPMQEFCRTAPFTVSREQLLPSVRMMNRSALRGHVVILQASISPERRQILIEDHLTVACHSTARVKMHHGLVYAKCGGTVAHPVGSKLSTGDDPLLLLSRESREISTGSADRIASTPSCCRSALGT